MSWGTKLQITLDEARSGNQLIKMKILFLKFYIVTIYTHTYRQKKPVLPKDRFCLFC